MAYADASPAEIETRLQPKPKARRRAVSSAAPSEASIWPKHAKGVPARTAGAILRRVAVRLGMAIAAGLLNPPEKPKPKPIDPILRLVDLSRPVRALVGRVDVSGDSDGASWAKLVNGVKGRELHVYYRHGREVLVELMAAVEGALRAAGLKIREVWRRIERARQFGGSAFVAIIPLMPQVSPPPAPALTKKRRRQGNLSAGSRVPA